MDLLAVSGVLCTRIAREGVANVTDRGWQLVKNVEAGEILESIGTAVLLADMQLRIVYANNAAEQLFGMSRTRLCHFRIDDLLGPDQQYIVDILHSATRPDFQGFVATDILLDQHLARHTRIDLSLAMFAGGSKGIVVEMRSLEHQQKLIEDLQRNEQHLAARDLIVSLAHEIKNPLGGIRGAAQLLELAHDHADLQVSDYTKVIIEQADRLKNLVDRMLGPQKPSPTVSCNIHYVLEKVLALQRLDSCSAGIRFDKDYDPSLPEIELDLDAMQQALINVVSNAAQVLQESATRNPVITVRTRARSGAVLNGVKHRTSLAIYIIDNGPGVPEHIRDVVFFPMVTTRKSGTGLGLPIAQHIIACHKGTIECQSSTGQTVFTITLPYLNGSRPGGQ